MGIYYNETGNSNYSNNGLSANETFNTYVNHSLDTSACATNMKKLACYNPKKKSFKNLNLHTVLNSTNLIWQQPMGEWSAGLMTLSGGSLRLPL